MRLAATSNPAAAADSPWRSGARRTQRHGTRRSSSGPSRCCGDAGGARTYRHTSRRSRAAAGALTAPRASTASSRAAVVARTLARRSWRDTVRRFATRRAVARASQLRRRVARSTERIASPCCPRGSRARRRSPHTSRCAAERVCDCWFAVSSCADVSMAHRQSRPPPCLIPPGMPISSRSAPTAAFNSASVRPRIHSRAASGVMPRGGRVAARQSCGSFIVAA